MEIFRKRIVGIFVAIAMLVSTMPVSQDSIAHAAEGTVTVAEPEFSKESGNYKDRFDLTLSVPERTTVYYSTDGSDPVPDATSAYVKQYTLGETIDVHDRTGEANILATAENADLMNQEGDHYYQPTAEQVAKATVIRAMAVDAQGNRSSIVTKTYFVGKNLTTRHAGLPVISLATDPKNLLSADKGIFVEGNNKNYDQHGQAWERLTDMTYFNKKGEVDLASPVGIRVRGGYTRKYQQKSLNIYFREEYGKKNWKYELFPDAMNHDRTEKTTKHKNFMLRNGGNDANMTKLTDVFLQSLVRDRNISTQCYQPCAVYLNGEYWGMYNMMERYSDNWLEEEFGVDKDNVVLIKDGEVDVGDEDADIALFEELKALAELDMTKEENYQKFLNAVELSSYLDYYATEVIIANHDWGLIKNNQFWRARTKTDKKYEDGKWRWLLHDTEFSMGLWGPDPDLIHQMISSEDSEKQDPLFAAVSKNKQFRQAFANTILELLANNFNYTKNVAAYDALVNLYKPHVMESLYRFGSDWGKGSEESCFNSRVKGLKETWAGKEATVLDQLKSNFSYRKEDQTEVTFTGDAENIIVNKVTKKLNDGKYVGTYYKKDPIVVAAPEVAGCQFAGWQVTGGTAEDASAVETSVTLQDKSASIKAVYTKPQEPQAPKKDGGSTPAGGDQTISKKVQPVITTVTKVKKPKKAKLVSVTSKKKRTMKIKIKKQSNVAGYQVVYAQNKKFTKAKKTKITKKTSLTIKKLKRKKKYYVKVRAFCKNGTKKIYGKYSNTKRVKIK